MSQRFRVFFQYRGTKFMGWQRQSEAVEKKHAHGSVQIKVENALRKVVKHHAPVVIAGRTDTGVHALRNCLHFDLPVIVGQPMITCNQLQRAWNGALRDPDIYIHTIEKIDQTFHARFSAIERTYTYRFGYIDDGFGLPFQRDSFWHLREPIDLDLLHQASAVFTGKRDMSALKSPKDQSDPIRDIFRFTITADPSAFPGAMHRSGREIGRSPLVATIQARSFMYHQIRRMMACVVEVATKKMTIEQLEEMLPKKDTKIPVMAPSCGLMLADIKYPDKFAVTEKTTSWFWGSPFLKHLDP